MRLRTVSTRDALVAEVRRQILSGILRPGEALTETSLAAKFGVARPTVRSALQVLKGMHLAQPSLGRSLVVPILTEADVRDLFLVRTPLELETVRVIVEGGVDPSEARRRLREMSALPADASWAERVEGHTAFHVALVEAAASVRLTRIYPSLQEEMQLCLAQLHGHYPDPRDLAEEHQRLLDEIASGDLARAQREMREHLARALRNLTSPG
jgi:DNA-binding GntR family transcriptional regulator